MEVFDPKKTIQIHICHENFLIWDPETVFLVRFTHRIVGNLIGCFPHKPRQNGQFSLPLQLSNIEVKFLLDHCQADLVNSCVIPSDLELNRYQEIVEEKRVIHFNAQTKLKRELKNKELNRMATSIQQGKIKKLGKRKVLAESTDKVTTLQNQDFEKFKINELNKVEKLNFDQTWIKMDIGSKFFLLSKDNSVKNNVKLSPLEQLKLAVFTHLHNKGFYLTDGLKFGGDFLVYPGDPGLYHSLYIVVCVPFNKHISLLEYSAMGRLATSVKKTLLLCSQNEKGELVYSSMDWSGLV